MRVESLGANSRAVMISLVLSRKTTATELSSPVEFSGIYNANFLLDGPSNTRTDLHSIRISVSFPPRPDIGQISGTQILPFFSVSYYLMPQHP
jgi:hypothetical protein